MQAAVAVAVSDLPVMLQGPVMMAVVMAVIQQRLELTVEVAAAVALNFNQAQQVAQAAQA
jgi:hypothetical protein